VPSVNVPGAASAPELKAHLAVPPVGDGPWPGVVVLHENFGLNDDVREHAERLAAAGYLALAPNLFTAGRFRCIQAGIRAVIKGAGEAFEDIEAARRFLARRPECSDRVGVIGFCIGGGFALLVASRGFDAAAANYGPVYGDLDERLRGACPVIASYGAKDRLIPGHGGKLERALERSAVIHDFEQYPDAGHSFLNRPAVGPLGPVMRVTAGVGFHGPSAEHAWTRILRFFDEHLREAAEPIR